MPVVGSVYQASHEYGTPASTHFCARSMTSQRDTARAIDGSARQSANASSESARAPSRRRRSASPPTTSRKKTPANRFRLGSGRTLQLDSAGVTPPFGLVVFDAPPPVVAVLAPSPPDPVEPPGGPSPVSGSPAPRPPVPPGRVLPGTTHFPSSQLLPSFAQSSDCFLVQPVPPHDPPPHL